MWPQWPGIKEIKQLILYPDPDLKSKTTTCNLHASMSAVQAVSRQIAGWLPTKNISTGQNKTQSTDFLNLHILGAKLAPRA